MADQRLTDLTALTAPASDDSLYIVDKSDTTENAAGSSKKIAVSDLVLGYALAFLSGGAFNPADATTYYIGNQPFAPVTGSTSRPLWIPRAGIVKAIYGTVLSAVAGTSENSTLSFRLNDTTDTAISTTLDLSSARHDFSNAALSIAVAAGDYCSLKWVTPTWVTNPTTVVFTASVIIAI